MNLSRNYQRGRPLTYDERRAAAAAFAAEPFDPDWSTAARVIYDGIVNAMSVCRADAVPQPVPSLPLEMGEP
jgi:hypothetical protein